MIRATHHEKDGRTARVEVTWNASRGMLVGESSDGEVFEYLAESLTVKRGGWRGEALLIVCGEGEEAYSLSLDDRASIEELERRAREFPRALEDAVRAQLHERRRSMRRRRIRDGILAFVLLSPFLLLGLALIAPGLVIAPLVPFLPYSLDEKLGESVESDLADELDDERLVGVLRSIGERLLANVEDCPFTFRYHVVRDDTVNAFAAPGGVVVFHTALLRDLETPEELAGVLGHEFAHVLERHSMRQLLRTISTSVLWQVLFGSSDGLAFLPSLLDLRFSRSQEREADRRGYELLRDAGIDPGGLASFLERLDRHGETPPEFLSTHPDSEERAAEVRRWIERDGRPTPRPLAIDWEAFQERLQRD
ncbi:MAG: M48 family metallopeptidase [Planctomycetes bacterium]|nr:M48 family metallopeptidase [Planctomycetota bacterium]MCB9890898.1 M48 family metallopeptidase [Planctomycetota bacterium]